MRLTILLLAASLAALAASPSDLAKRWMAAKFLGHAEAAAAEPQLQVQLKSGEISRHRIRDRAFQIGGQSYADGIHMPSPGEILVQLPSAASTLEAVVGVDSNDLGYYANAGRGSVVASVESGGRELFRSAVLHEGLAGAPVRVDLTGAREFRLKLTAVGEHSRTWQAEWDQADWADARVKMSDGSTIRLSDLPAGPLPGGFDAKPPFSFRYDGKPSTELLKSWKVERTARNGRTEVRYTDPATGLVVRAAVRAYQDFPVVEWTLYLRNTGSKPTPILEDIHPLDTRLERSPEGEFLLRYWKGSPNSATDFQPLQAELSAMANKRLSASGGRPTDSYLSYFNLDAGRAGYIVGIGWPGQWAADFSRDNGRGVTVAAGQEGAHFRLLPGEEVRTPLVVLQFWGGDWIAGQNGWRRWMLAHNLPRVGGRLPTPQLAGGSNRHTIEMQDANEENQLAFLKQDLDAGLPLDYWWMDAGWYPFQEGWWNTGTWEPDPKRFPHGFTPISAAAKARGVKTIVWFEPERVTAGSWLATRHPEWLLGKDSADKLLYLGNPEALHWLTEHVGQMIAEQGIGLYRQDFNFEPLERWQHQEAPDRQGIHEIKHVTGLLAFWDALLTRFPALRIDVCASGGRRDDLEELRRAVPLWRSDYAYEPVAMQNFTYGMSFWIPYFGTAVNSVDPYLFRSQMTPAIGMGFEPSRIENGYERVKRLLDQWRSISVNYYADFYPLTPYSTETTAWLAWQFDRPEAGEGMVQAFRRPDSPFETARFRLRGLDPRARYTVTDIDSGAARECTGRALAEAGLEVAIPHRPGAVIQRYVKRP